MRRAIKDMSFIYKLKQYYSGICSPLCRSTGLPHTAIDIIMFLANNPEYKSASDIVEIRFIKKNLVSVNVERLVEEGYLERRADDDDRRKVTLLLTCKADPIIKEGRKIQNEFMKCLLKGVSTKEQEEFEKIIGKMCGNLDE